MGTIIHTPKTVTNPAAVNINRTM